MTNIVMVDIETLGDTANAAMISVGAVKFDPRGDDLSLDVIESRRAFHRNIDFQSALYYGDATGHTLAWWFEQSAEARAALFAPEPVRLKQALNDFAQWIDESPGEIWAKPPSFDLTILGGAFRKTGLRVPWQHRAERCLRTLLALQPAEAPENPVAHSAVHDAWAQAVVCQRALKRWRGED